MKVPIKRRLLSIGGALIMGASGALVAVVPAQAYSFEYQVATSRSWMNGPYYCAANHGDATVGNATAYGCLQPNGDVLQIADASADHKRVGLWWKTDYGRSGVCVNLTGKDFVAKGPYKEPSGKHVCDKDFKEGHYVTFQVATCNGSAVNCRKRANWHEWSDQNKIRT